MACSIWMKVDCTSRVILPIMLVTINLLSLTGFMGIPDSLITVQSYPGYDSRWCYYSNPKYGSTLLPPICSNIRQGWEIARINLHMVNLVEIDLIWRNLCLFMNIFPFFLQTFPPWLNNLLSLVILCNLCKPLNRPNTGLFDTWLLESLSRLCFQRR